MRRPVGIETEYGVLCEGFPEAVDFAYECSRLVRAAPVDGAFRGWDYRHEDPYRDLRGMRVTSLDRDPRDLETRTDRSRTLTREELLANTVLINGARLYNDHHHPEYCTEACLTLADLVAHDRAGERVVLAAQERRNEELAAEYGPAVRVRLVKNNTDYHGRSYGTHENYLLARAIPLDAVMAALIPFLVTRQLLAGAGKVGYEAEQAARPGGAAGYQLSQRADFIEETVGINTTARRPIFNTRDEPHADAARYRRLHVIVGDANRSEYAAALKVGTTALVLDLLDAGWRSALELRDAVGAIKTIARDLTFTARVELSGGERVTALEIQRRYQDAAAGRFGGADGETDWVLREWAEVLDALVTDPLVLRDRLDWAAKLAVLESVRGQTGAGWDDPRLRRLEVAYHVLESRLSLFDALSSSGQLRRFVTDEQIDRALDQPPSGTRGVVRALCLRKFGTAIRRIEWDSLTIGGNGREFVLQLPELSGPLVQRVADLAARAADADVFIDYLQRGGLPTEAAAQAAG